ncbi:uncharacterized protein HMPREF1120_05412 [Exophiala dermatitidis NIH/UT8656]|uniref:Uncharacterized protein n=1 Tax=Exophiala dermatitidis (strain ATCC 34100 / CBS 525.76 / NIH/UT8656) TaxID=858893 RepID=H6C190_EXODN|nr:uncharacterized protein HMPREF1120_05412 [Exophiala dermatitidis NIH/UT8656]EHY57373.1 hypothetical protein HMPREF1120_05412 [Exophiala dermatitidis NIH/UT8656]
MLNTGTGARNHFMQDAGRTKLTMACNAPGISTQHNNLRLFASRKTNASKNSSRRHGAVTLNSHCCHGTHTTNANSFIQRTIPTALYATQIDEFLCSMPVLINQQGLNIPKHCFLNTLPSPLIFVLIQALLTFFQVEVVQYL